MSGPGAGDGRRGAGRRPGRPRDPGLDEAILVATVELLCEQGFAGTTVEAVAERAGVGKATIYRRWATREDLLLAAGGSMGACPPDPDTGDLREDLVVLIAGLVSLMTETPMGGLLAATVDEAARNPALRARLDTFIADRRTPVRHALQAAAERGELRAGVDHELLVDQLAGPVFTRILLTGGPLDHGLAERIVDGVLTGALARRT